MTTGNFNANKKNMWDTFPQLETDRLLLRKMVSEDKSTLFDLWSNPQVNKYTDFLGLQDMNIIERIFKMIQEGFLTKTRIRWAICLKNDPKMIGTIGFNRWVTERGNFAVLGYDLHPSFWRKGYMFEAGKRVVEYGFQEMKLHRIQADYNPANVASEKLLLKLGFQIEGVRRDAAFWGGKFQSLGTCGKLSSD